MCIRKAAAGDETRILALYTAAREFMRESGNPTQWPYGYPGLEDIQADLARESLFVHERSGELDAVFFFAAGPDSTYAQIDGAWLNDESYAVVHRIAAKRGSGAGRRCLAWACKNARNLRIDTHEDNGPMRHVLRELGFVECGTIICDNGTPRVAYHHVADASKPAGCGTAWLLDETR